MIGSIFPFIVASIGAAWRLPPALAAEQTSAADASRQTSETWNDAKQGFADAYKDLQRACNKVIGQFK